MSQQSTHDMEMAIVKSFDPVTSTLKTTSPALVSGSYDYISTTYVGATTNINTVVYKLGGASGTIVATLTMGYDGSNRLISVTRS